MLELAIYNAEEHFQKTIEASSFSIGSKSSGDSNHFVISDVLVSPLQCQLEVFGDESGNQVRITNLGRSLVLNDGYRIHHGVTAELELPFTLGAGETRIQVSLSSFESSLDKNLQQLPVVGAPNSLEHVRQSQHDISPSSETLTSWFEALGQIQRSTAGHSEFFKLAARCIFNPGGLDGCIILRRYGDQWQVAAQHIPYPEYGICYRKDLIDMAVVRKSVLYHGNSQDQPELLAIGTSDRIDDWKHDLHSAVVCPILDTNDEVIAIAYGFRSCHRNNNRNGIRLLEAKFVALVADSISAGMIRLDQEADSARKRVLLQQAFSSEVAKQLETNPDILKGRNREVTVLFADIRNFCCISENIGASLTYQLLTDVMDRFTQIIHEHEGVVIDYYGDGISAFWNAPVDQPNHAELACNAAMVIENVMSDLNETWSHEIGCRLRVGVGVHTGNAQVGNSGSRNRLKYGPQGTTVNIASRLEQATKKIGVGVIVSGETARRVADHYIPQKICSAKFSGINTTTELTQLVHPNKYSRMTDYYLRYQDALQKFEANNFQGAVELLSNMDDQHESEALTEFLLQETVNRLGVPAVTPDGNEPEQDEKDATANNADLEKPVVAF